MKLVEVYQEIVPEAICIDEYSPTGFRYEARRDCLGCRLYERVPGSCIELLESIVVPLQELVENGRSELRESSYRKTMQLAYLFLLPRLASSVDVVTYREKRARSYVVRVYRRTTTDIPYTGLTAAQIASSILRAHVLDPSKPITRLLLSLVIDKPESVIYDGLSSEDALVVELLSRQYAKNLGKWHCFSIPCRCTDFKAYSDGKGRTSRGIVTSVRVLSIAAIPLLISALSGVAVITLSGVKALHEVYEGMSKSLRAFFEALYGARLDSVAKVLRNCMEALREELDKERVVYILEESGIESLKLTAYFMKAL